MSTARAMFDPAALPPRDDKGYTLHPDVWLRCWYDGNPEDEAPLCRDSFNALAVDITYLARNDDQLAIIDPNDEDQMDGLYDAGGGCASWSPPVPEPIDGRAWRLVGIYDTEDGPAAAFVRDLTFTPTMLPQRSCRKCGCTEDRACTGGCNWMEPDLCSACVAA